jgi:hypothetical protein
MLKRYSIKSKSTIFTIVILLLIMVIICFLVKRGTSVEKLPTASKLTLCGDDDDYFISTNITINRDGSFKGSSYKSGRDSWNDDSRSYECSFHGEFSKMKKLSNEKYDMILTALKYDKESKSDSGSGDMSAYGLKKGVKYVMYFDGASMQGMNKTFLQYSPGYNVKTQKNNLIGNALWNTKDGYGFFSGWDK